MTKSVTVEELAEHLRDRLAEVEEGTVLQVIENGRNIATITPPLSIRFPTSNKRPGDFEPGPRPPNLRTDPAEIIIEERERERSGEKYK